MTKQEEIREVTKNCLVGYIHGATVSYADLSGYDRSTVDFQADELLEEQSKLGVVLKVDIAQVSGCSIIGKTTAICPYKEAGFAAIEPLFEYLGGNIK